MRALEDDLTVVPLRRCMRWTQVVYDFYAETGSIRLDARRVAEMGDKPRWDDVWKTLRARAQLKAPCR